jgi:hypothetical protein
LIWKPLWRPLILAGAVVLHLGIGLCLGMWTFGLIMLVGCASFLPNEAVRQFVTAIRPGTAGAGTEVVHSDSRPMRGSVRLAGPDRRGESAAVGTGARARS